MVIYSVTTPTEKDSNARKWIGISEGKIAAMGAMIADHILKEEGLVGRLGSYTYPGFIDAHGHLFGYAEMLTMVH